ncbi:MAG: DUF2147 domain-containing protein [Mangrovibacterium sp.]
MKKILLVLLMVVLVKLVGAQTAQSIVGIWWNQEKTSKIEVVEKDGHYTGKIIYLAPEKYVDGQAPKDTQNPDEKLRNRSMLGLQILSGLSWVPGDKQWQNGKIYDPKSGKSYDCYAWFEGSTDKLFLKGYVVGIKWLGRSTEWTRLK